MTLVFGNTVMKPVLNCSRFHYTNGKGCNNLPSHVMHEIAFFGSSGMVIITHLFYQIKLLCCIPKVHELVALGTSFKQIVTNAPKILE